MRWDLGSHGEGRRRFESDSPHFQRERDGEGESQAAPPRSHARKDRESDPQTPAPPRTRGSSSFGRWAPPSSLDPAGRRIGGGYGYGLPEPEYHVAIQLAIAARVSLSSRFVPCPF